MSVGTRGSRRKENSTSLWRKSGKRTLPKTIAGFLPRAKIEDNSFPTHLVLLVGVRIEIYEGYASKYTRNVLRAPSFAMSELFVEGNFVLVEKAVSSSRALYAVILISFFRGIQSGRG